jgi:uncharacterized protein (TIGR00369 family)
MSGSVLPDLEAVVQRVPYAAFLGMQAERDGEGLLFRLPFAERLIGNPTLPAIHGGVVAGFMENAALLHLLVAEPEQPRLPKTIDFSIDYLRSARARDCLARTSIERLGRRVGQVLVRCWQADPDRPVALARAHYLLEPLDHESKDEGT